MFDTHTPAPKSTSPPLTSRASSRLHRRRLSAGSVGNCIQPRWPARLGIRWNATPLIATRWVNMCLKAAPWMASRVAGLSLVLGTATLIASPPAAAVAPTNDSIAGAITVPTLPFSTSLDTSEATAEEDGPAATVWYEFTPPTTGDYDITTVGSDYDTDIGVWAASPFLHAFSAGQVAMRQQLLGGETYYFKVGNLCCLAEAGQVGPDGNLVLNIRRSVPIALTVTIDPTATLGRGEDFPVTVSGTIKCSQDGLATLDGVLRQAQGAKVAQGDFSDAGLLSIPCSPTPTAWSRTVTGGDRKFVAKSAALTTTGTACDAPFFLGCDYGQTLTRAVVINR
jgi:hypothetical protein